MRTFGQVVLTTLISQVIAFLNAVFSPFEGTIFVFDDWERIASRTAVAVGFIVVLGLVALNRGASASDLKKRAIGSLVFTLFLIGTCAAIYFILKSGFAPTPLFLFWLRDLVWMWVYIGMLVMVGVTISFFSLLLKNGGSGGAGKRSSTRARA
jgi:hypothetical protein